MSRRLSSTELSTYSRMASLLEHGQRDLFIKQLSEIFVENEDNGHTYFSTSIEATSLDAESFNYTLDLFYDDLDGQIVSLIAHFVPPGVISFIERFRYDGDKVQIVHPAAEDVRFRLHR